MKDAGPVRQNKNIAEALTVVRAAKEIVAAIRSPKAAALMRRRVPTRQQRMKIRAVCSNFPKRSGVGGSVGNCKPNAFVVRREDWSDGLPLHGGNASCFAAVCARYPEIRSLGKHQVLSVGRPSGSVLIEPSIVTPSLRGAPAGSGSVQRGASSSGRLLSDRVETSSCERSGEMSSIEKFLS